jgi:hypothetical protein
MFCCLIRSQASVRKWAAEVAVKGRFVAPMPPDQAGANPGSLPVPCLVINNKADLRGKTMISPHPSNRKLSRCSREACYVPAIFA